MNVPRLLGRAQGPWRSAWRRLRCLFGSHTPAQTWRYDPALNRRRRVAECLYCKTWLK